MAKSLRQAYLDAQEELKGAGISDETRLLLRKYHAVWARGKVLRSLRRLIAADNMTQKENARTEAQLANARAMVRAGKPL